MMNLPTTIFIILSCYGLMYAANYMKVKSKMVYIDELMQFVATIFVVVFGSIILKLQSPFITITNETIQRAISLALVVLIVLPWNVWLKKHYSTKVVEA